MRKARAGFAANFFGCAGLQVIDNPGFSSPEEGCKAAEAAGAGFVVICSGDEEYAEIVPSRLRNLPAGAIPVLAGYPADLVEGFKALGLKNFIHIRSNVKETLEDFLRQAGIETRNGA